MLKIPQKSKSKRKNIPNNQDATQRILADLGTGKLKGEVDIFGLLILDPFGEIAANEDNVIKQPGTLRHDGLKERPVQIETQSLMDLVDTILDTIACSRLISYILKPCGELPER